MKRALVIVLGVAFGACGDNGKSVPSDGSTDGAADAAIDAPMAPTFTSFVIDVIQNQTSNTTNPVPFATFMGLPDPDLNNPNAYNVLFP